MCQRIPDDRISSFFDVERHLQSNRFLEIGFSEDEISCYRVFADALEKQITKVENGAKYQDDIDKFQTGLDNAYRSFMLEEFVPDSSVVAQCIIRGSYYRRQKGLHVWKVRDFLQMMKGLSPEKKRIVTSNLHTRLDAIPRYDEVLDGEIPF